METVIDVKNVSKSFGKEIVLSDINMELKKGHIYGIVGKNGSGKSVLFKLIAGYLKPTTGSISVMGKRVGKEVDFPESMGLIIETPGFLSQYTGFQNLEYLANIRHLIDTEDIKDAIKLVGLDPSSKKKVGKYSLGMKQRLAIAQAIMEKPEVILLDEPMNGLDKRGVGQIKNLLLDLKREGKLILMTSHYAEDVQVCDEIYELDNGCLKEFTISKLEEH